MPRSEGGDKKKKKKKRRASSKAPNRYSFYIQKQFFVDKPHKIYCFCMAFLFFMFFELLKKNRDEFYGANDGGNEPDLFDANFGTSNCCKNIHFCKFLFIFIIILCENIALDALDDGAQPASASQSMNTSLDSQEPYQGTVQNDSVQINVEDVEKGSRKKKKKKRGGKPPISPRTFKVFLTPNFTSQNKILFTIFNAFIVL